MSWALAALAPLLQAMFEDLAAGDQDGALARHGACAPRLAAWRDGDAEALRQRMAAIAARAEQARAFAALPLSTRTAGDGRLEVLMAGVPLRAGGQTGGFVLAAGPTPQAIEFVPVPRAR